MVKFWKLSELKDKRGSLIELWRKDQLVSEHYPAMGYLSWTEVGESRGPHEHSDQTDFFVFSGPGDFELYLWIDGEKQKHLVGESNPVAVMVPPGVVHGYRNISSVRGLVLNFPNELYAGPGKRYEVDEIRWEETDRYIMD